MTAARRLILHVGQTKAGSTAIQNYLDSQRATLRAAGILFPETFLLRRNPADPTRTPGHLGLIEALSGATPLDPFEAERAAADCPVLVLSMENLFMDLPDSDLAALGAYWQGWEVELVAVLRSFPDWLASRYIEEVLTGYRRGGMVLDDFTAATLDQGAHDYAGRLDHLSALLNARRTLAINYDAATAGDGLVPAFLRMTGLPLTDPGLARGIQANVREKSWFLVESARRQNHPLRAARKYMKRHPRRQFEALIRARAREIAASLPESLPDSGPVPTLSGADVLLPAEACRQIAASNRRLAQGHGLDQALPDPDPDPAPGDPPQRRQHRQDWPGTDELTVFGLRTAATLSHEVAAAAALEGHDSPTDAAAASLLAEPGIGLAIAELARARVSLHLDSPETALWAATLGGRLPVLLASGATPLAACDRLLGMQLPSDVVCLAPTDGLVPVLRRILRDRPPQALVIPAASPPGLLVPLHRLIRPETTVILTGADAATIPAIADGLDLAVKAREGRVTLLARPAGYHDPNADPSADPQP